MCHYYNRDLETNMGIPGSNPFISFVYVYEIIILLRLSEIYNVYIYINSAMPTWKTKEVSAPFPLYTESQGQVPRQGFDFLPGPVVHGAGAKAPGYRTEHGLVSWGGVLNPLSTWGSQTTEHSHQWSAVLSLKIFSKSQPQAVQTIESLFKCLPVLELEEA